MLDDMYQLWESLDVTDVQNYHDITMSESSLAAYLKEITQKIHDLLSLQSEHGRHLFVCDLFSFKTAKVR
jgi:hypothetical protein